MAKYGNCPKCKHPNTIMVRGGTSIVSLRCSKCDWSSYSTMDLPEKLVPVFEQCAKALAALEKQWGF